MRRENVMSYELVDAETVNKKIGTFTLYALMHVFRLHYT